MKNLTRYQILIKNEQQKVRDVVGTCYTRCEPDNTARENLDFMRNMLENELANEKNNTFSRTERSGGLSEAETGERRRIRERRRGRRQRQRNLYQDTNVYTFENQSLEANSLGESNKLTERAETRREALRNVLKKYRRTGYFD